MITAAIMLTAFLTIALYTGSETAQGADANMTNATAAAGANMTNATQLFSFSNDIRHL